MCLIIRSLINGHITVCSACSHSLYSCFNMPLIIGAVMCSFFIPIIMKHSACAVAERALSIKQIVLLAGEFTLCESVDFREIYFSEMMVFRSFSHHTKLWTEFNQSSSQHLNFILNYSLAFPSRGNLLHTEHEQKPPHCCYLRRIVSPILRRRNLRSWR